MKPSALDALLDSPEAAYDAIPAEALPALIAEASAAQGRLAAVSLNLTTRLAMQQLRRSEAAPDEPLLSAEDVAGRLAVAKAAVYELMRSGGLRFIQVGKYKRVRPADLERWLKQREGGGLEHGAFSGTQGTPRGRRI